ncbi:hypothetical protein BGZ72_004560 [Mortierella alpina]|nr:hypothetical protein BGZ72_004560 [Mortierella alpina]
MATTTATAATTALRTLTTTIVSATVSLSSTLSPASIPAPAPTMSISPAPNAHGAESDSLKESTKIVGLSLAIGSGLLIGASFVFKKKGLINCTKHGMAAGEGHAYLKSVMWWTGMLMMVAGEVCNFVAYAFVQPILVTPLGALSVVICAILSSIFLKERLNLQGKVGCAQCIVGATIIVLHAPEQTSVKTIQEFAHFMKQPVFLVWMFMIIILSLWLIIKAGPRWGKDHMMVYIGVCSLIGSLSVVSTQALGAAIVHNISTGEPQFNTWFTYFVIVFMVITLLTEINYLNKALNLFNTAMVTPTYYVTFTSTTIITSAILYQGFHASVVAILTVCFGFLVICGGVLLLQTSKPVVPLQLPGSSISSLGGTLTYEDIEPNAADLRASFGSLRRFSRDLRQTSISGPNGVFQSSPLNPKTGSLMRKRRASNATQQSRPQSVLASHGHLAPPGHGPLAGGAGTAGGATAFYPSSTGAYSTMVMGPNGSTVRLQLCEIVISDEKNETTSRYQVYRPVPPLGDVGATTGYKQQMLQSRTGVPSDSRSSSVRFGDNVPRPSQDENEKEEYHQPSTPVQKYPSPISGSLFVPPKTAASHSATATPAAPGSPASPAAASGPLVVGGSFFSRPRFRSPSTSTAASGDIMEINDPGHAGRTVVSIEPVQQQPLYSLYVPPPPTGPATNHRPTSPLASAPLQPVDSTSSSSSSSSSSTANNAVGCNNNDSVLSSHEKSALRDSTTHDGQDAFSDGDSSTCATAAGASPSSVSTKSTKPHGIFGKLFSKSPQKKNLNPSGTSLLPLTTTPLDFTDASPPVSPSSSSLSSPLAPPPQIVFNRANHPTRISEGEEEEDTEDLKQQSG